MNCAVLIGINSYRHVTGLNGCINDVEDIAKRLSETHGATGIRITQLVDENASKTAIVAAIASAMQTLTTGDRAYVHFSGHGVQLPSTDASEPDALDEVICPHDFDWTANTALADHELYELINRRPPGSEVLVTIDSCHSGDQVREPSSRNLTLPRTIVPPAAVRAELARRGRSTHRLARLAGSAEIGFLSACSPREVATDTWFDGRANGAFTYHFLRAQQTSPVATLEEIRLALEPNLRSYGMTPVAEGDVHLTWAHHSAVPVAKGNDPGVCAVPSAGQRPGHSRREPRSRSGLDTLIHETPTIGERMSISNPALAKLGNWPEVSAELLRRFPHGQTLPLPQLGDFVPSTTAPPRSASGYRAATGPAIVRTFFWGFHIEISSQGLRDFLSVADPVTAIVASMGPVTGPAAPFVTLAAAFAAGALQVLRGLDRGNGVYLSMSWFAPGVFIPTTVGNRAATASRAVYPLQPEVHGNIFRVLTALYTENDSDGDGQPRFTLRTHNRSGAPVDVNIDRSHGVAATGHIANGQSSEMVEPTQVYVNHRNKVTRWRPGVFGAWGNGGGEIFFNVPHNAADVLIELEVVG